MDDISTHIDDLQGPLQTLWSWLDKYKKIEQLELLEHFRDRLQNEVQTFQTGKLHKLSPLWLVIASLHDLRLEFDSVETGEMKKLVNCLDAAVDKVLQQPCEPDDHGRTYVFPRCCRNGIPAATSEKEFLEWLSGLFSVTIEVPDEIQKKCSAFVQTSRMRKMTSMESSLDRSADLFSDGFHVWQVIKLIRHCSGTKKSLHDVDDFFTGKEEAPLDQRELSLLTISLRRALVAPQEAEWWNHSMMARAILIGISQLGADGNMTGLQYVLRSAVKLQSQVVEGSFHIDDGRLFGWTMLPVRLFGVHISCLKGDSRALVEFENRLHQVQLRCIPQFLLQVTRLDGIVTSQIAMAQSLQTNILAGVFGIFLIAGHVAMKLYLEHLVERSLHWS